MIQKSLFEKLVAVFQGDDYIRYLVTMAKIRKREGFFKVQQEDFE